MDRSELLNPQLRPRNLVVVARLSSAKNKPAWMEVQTYSSYTEALVKVTDLKKKHPKNIYVIAELTDRGLDIYQ
jgi:hypothetical protein